MLKGIVSPKIAREHKCKDCGCVFRPGYYDFDIKCPECGSDKLRPVWIDFLLVSGSATQYNRSCSFHLPIGRVVYSGPIDIYDRRVD